MRNNIGTCLYVVKRYIFTVVKKGTGNDDIILYDAEKGERRW